MKVSLFANYFNINLGYDHMVRTSKQQIINSDNELKSKYTWKASVAVNEKALGFCAKPSKQDITLNSKNIKSNSNLFQTQNRSLSWVINKIRFWNLITIYFRNRNGTRTVGRESQSELAF